MSRTAVWLIAIFVVAVGVRVALLAVDPHPAAFSGLSSADGNVARNILVHGRWDFVVNDTGPTPKVRRTEPGELLDVADLDWTGVDRRPRYRPVISMTPGTGILLAGIWKVTGDDRYIYLQVFQLLMDAAMVFVVFWIAMALFGRRRTALLAALGWAVSLQVTRWTNVPHVDIWAIDFNVVAAALFLKATRAPRAWPWLVATGLVAGAGLWFRPVLAPFAMALVMAFWIGPRRALGFAAVPALIAALCIAPWFVRNEHEFHRLIYRTGTGQGTWEGLGLLHNDFGAQLDDEKTKKLVEHERPDIRYGTVQFDDYLRQKAMRTIKAHPGFYAKILADRLYIALVRAHAPWNGSYPGVPGPKYAASPGGAVRFVRDRPLWAAALVALKVPATALFLAVLPTLVLLRRRFARQFWLLAAIAVSAWLPYLLFNLDAQYALPGTFAYLIVGALGLDLAIEAKLWQRLPALRQPRMAAR
jgi:4-amino-4-deoxy-L-arabinose transferase-like glycosyltransferase